MTNNNPVIAECAFCLAHVPDLVQFGSKPRREIMGEPKLGDALSAALRDYPSAVAYPPNQTFIGNITPESLALIERPWYSAVDPQAQTGGPFGEIVDQACFFAALEAADVLEPPIVNFNDEDAEQFRAHLAAHPVLAPLAATRRDRHHSTAHVDHDSSGEALQLTNAGRVCGTVARDNRAEGREDENLAAHILLEGLCSKASGAIALQKLLNQAELAPDSIDFIISCGEEAAGDRYQRGGGGMAKAIGEMCGLRRASGMDIKNFCAAPASALVTAGALVKAGLYERVVVVAGGSLAKLGMKFQAVLRDGLPILGDVLGSMALVVTRDDGKSPHLRLDRGAVGTASIGASTSDQAIYHELIIEPLNALGLKLTDIDRFAPELHNCELMEYAGSGDVARKNYKMIAATAVLNGAIEREEMNDFIARVGMPGFAPPQGHIPSGVPYLSHALRAMRQGTIERAMFVCKASLFLNRLTALYDGVSFVIERQPSKSVRGN